DQEEVERVRVDADVHLQRHRPDRGLRPPELAQGLAHPVGRVAGSGRMVIAREEEQQGVAAELEQAAARGVGDVEQALEGAVHHLRHLLGAELALLREPLVQGREDRDVDEGQRALELPVSRLRRIAQPVDDDARNERRQVDERWTGLRNRGHWPPTPPLANPAPLTIVARLTICSNGVDSTRGTELTGGEDDGDFCGKAAWIESATVRAAARARSAVARDHRRWAGCPRRPDAADSERDRSCGWLDHLGGRLRAGGPPPGPGHP